MCVAPSPFWASVQELNRCHQLLAREWNVISVSVNWYPRPKFCTSSASIWGVAVISGAFDGLAAGSRAEDMAEMGWVNLECYSSDRCLWMCGSKPLKIRATLVKSTRGAYQRLTLSSLMHFSAVFGGPKPSHPQLKSIKYPQIIQATCITKVKKI
jgi:hypothetical protein